MDDRSSDLVIQLFLNLEKRLSTFIKYLPFNKENKFVVLPLLSSIIVEAGSLIDTILREEYSTPPKSKKDLNIKDFEAHYENRFLFSKKRTILFIYPPSYLIPFYNWIDGKDNNNTTLSWWQNYNKLKHSRFENIELSTYETAINVVCALHQIISQLPAFVSPMIRHNMISCGSFGIDDVKEQLASETANEITVLIESKLFATPNGRHSFPENINEIRPIKYGQSKRLAHFFGRFI